MLLILTPNIDPESAVYRQLLARLGSLENIQLRVHREQGVEQTLTELPDRNTAAVSLDDMRSMPGVERAVRVSEEYRVIGRHKGDERDAHFDYQVCASGKTRCTYSPDCVPSTHQQTSS